MTAPVSACSYDRTKLRPRILHLGFGAFARAHPMVYLHHGLAQGAGDSDQEWGVVAARLNSGEQALSDLQDRDGLYHVAEAEGDSISLHQIGVLCGTCHPRRDGPTALPELIASPDLAVILLTITEKGYCMRDGALDRAHPGIQADLEGSGDAASTAIGVIVAGLARRRAAGLGGLTVLSCDNLPSNGVLTRRAVLEFAAAKQDGLAQWIADQVAFPSSMVDRIVPAMTPASHATITEALGHADDHAILCEPFRQWVIEDNFAGARPPFAAGGAQLVADVQPFEEMKLRMLNGAHTALAWMGQLLGHETVSDCMEDAELRAMAQRLMLMEQAPTLSLPEGSDTDAYATALLRRFANPRLHHRLAQIAMDSSQKMPQRLFAPVLDQLKAGRPWPVSALAIAAWIEGLRRLPPLDDPRQAELRAAAAGPDPVAEVLALPGLVPADLLVQAEFGDRVRAAHHLLASDPRSALASCLAEDKA